MLASCIHLMQGTPYIYQGEELGMTNPHFREIGQYRDVESLNYYEILLGQGKAEEALQILAARSRDNSRTPMQWSGNAHAGFTTGTPWLRVNPNYTTIHAAAQMKDPDSVRSFYKQLIALRKSPEYKETIVYGTLEPVWEEQPNLMAYYRKGERTLLVMGNFQRERRSVVIPGGYKKVLLNNYKELGEEGEKLSLNGYQFLVLEV